jgi:hypothetical protein
MFTAKITRKGIVSVAMIVASLGIVLLIAGCQSKAKRDSAFTAALDSYYNTRQDCLWSNPINLTLVPDGNDQVTTQDLDALVTAGLLDRVPAAKPHHGRASAHKAEFELSDMGRVNWTADSARSGYGNFCFGHPQVNAIESYQRVPSGSQAQYDVSFRDSIALPAWAQLPQVQKAFPKVAEAATGETDSATLVKNGKSWQVQSLNTPSQPVG